MNTYDEPNTYDDDWDDYDDECDCCPCCCDCWGDED